jgi:hypothetical protein
MADEARGTETSEARRGGGANAIANPAIAVTQARIAQVLITVFLRGILARVRPVRVDGF